MTSRPAPGDTRAERVINVLPRTSRGLQGDQHLAEDVKIARVIGDVWFSAHAAWVTGRSTATETAEALETAVRLLLRN